MFNIPSEGWIALSIWFTVIMIPWVYSSILIKRINDSGVERWGAKKSKKRHMEETTQTASEVKL